MDYCINEHKPLEPEEGDDEETKYHHYEWYRTNRMAKKAIKNTMSDVVRGSIEEPADAIEFFESIAEKYRAGENAEAARLNKRFHDLKYNGTNGIRVHIMELIEINGKLKDMGLGFSEDIVVHQALDSLPTAYSNIRSTYNALEAKWNLNKLISVCVDEEERIKKEAAPTTAVNLVEKAKKKKNKLKVKKTTNFKTSGKPSDTKEPKVNKPFKFKCFFCKKIGHTKKECSGFKAWMVKKGESFPNSVFSLEINILSVNSHTYWLDSGSPIHITTSLQGITKRREPTRSEQQVRVGNGQRVRVEAIGTLKIDLGLGKFISLDNVFYIPSLTRNLISVGRLISYGLKLVMDSSGIKLFQGSEYIGSGLFSNHYLRLDCSVIEQEILMIENDENLKSMNSITGVKRTLFKNNSANLWHRRLGHISKQRLKTLEKNKILPKLDYSDLNDCIECFKGKLTNIRKTTAVRSTKLLELIHTDICGPFKHKTLCGNTYFITFTDDYSRYCYIYLLSEKSQALEAFQIYKTEVELQHEMKIKTVRSDRGGEFYGRFTSAGQQKGPFAMFLQEHGIKAQ